MPVPRVLAFAAAEEEPLGEREGYLMEFVAGESVAPRLLRKDEYETARGRLPEQLGRALAAVHRVDPAAIEGLAIP